MTKNLVGQLITEVSGPSAFAGSYTAVNTGPILNHR
jgi:hypothetical protein